MALSIRAISIAEPVTFLPRESLRAVNGLVKTIMDLRIPLNGLSPKFQFEIARIIARITVH